MVLPFLCLFFLFFIDQFTVSCFPFAVSGSCWFIYLSFWLPQLKTPWGENNFHAQQIFYQVHCTFSPITKQRDQMSPGQTSPVFENWLSTVHTVGNITIKILQRLLLPFQCLAWGVKIFGFSSTWFRLLRLHTCK